MKAPLLLLALLATFSVACSSDSEPSAGHRALALSPIGAATDFGTTESLAEWSDLGGLSAGAAWIVEGGDHRYVERDGATVLVLERNAPTLIRIPTDLAADDVDRIQLAVQETTRGSSSIKASLLSGQRRVPGSGGKTGVTVGEHDVAFRFFLGVKQQRGFGGQRIDRVELQIPAAEGALEVVSMVVEKVPISDYFPPEARGGIDLVTVAGDARRATCLLTGTRLATSLAVQHPGQSLHVSFALPTKIQRITGEPKLRVVLQPESGPAEQHELAFEPAADGTTGWQEFSRSLDDWVGGELTATFELIADPGLDLMCALGSPRLATRAPEARTVVLITSDTHRADHLGFLGNDVEVDTPMLEELASKGALFTDALSSTNCTGPSHISIFTGLPPRDTGVISNGHSLNPAANTLAEVFREAGFATLAAVSAMPVDDKVSGLGQGFDQYLVPDHVSERDATETLTVVMERLPDYDGVPLFVWIHLFDAHAPYLAHPDLVEPTSAGPSGLYSAEITYLDQELGKFLGLERIQSATIAFTSDHGEVLERGMDPDFNHVGLSLNTLAVPLILYSPGRIEPQTIERPVAAIDIGRTLLDFSDLHRVSFPGHNLLEVEGDGALPRFALEAHGAGVSVQSEQWFFTLQLRPREFDTLPPDEVVHSLRLHDVEADPYCEENVWEQHLDVVAELRRLAIGWLQESNPLESIAVTGIDKAELEASLAKLGYTMNAGEDNSVWFDSDCDCSWCSRFE